MTGGAGSNAVVIGAGLAGLACARALADRDRTPVVYERSRGVGGRCATRRVEGQPVDHGAAFFHGTDPAFLAAVRKADGATVLPGWPQNVEGDGGACLRRAYEPLEQRLSYAEGLTAFPKYLASGVTLNLEANVEGLSPESGGVRVRFAGGAEIRTPSLVLALPAPATLRLVAPLATEGREAAALLALLRMIGSQSCLTALAGYPLDVARPAWDVAYPEDSTIVQMMSHDSSKRADPAFVVLVIQARPCWSKVHLDVPKASWSAALVAEAARLVGPWAGRPSWVQAQRWKYARSDRGSEMSRPLRLVLRGGGRVIVTGESFAPGGGIEGAWLAGNAAAVRLLEEE